MSSSSSRAFTASTRCGYYDAVRGRLQDGERGRGFMMKRNAMRSYLLWEASGRVCGKRLKALLPILLEAMERHGHFDLAPEIRGKLLAMSAATVDRRWDRSEKAWDVPDDGPRRMPCDGAFPLERRRIGTIQRQASLRRTSWPALRLAAASSKPSCSPTSRPAGRNVRRCWFANRRC